MTAENNQLDNLLDTALVDQRVEDSPSPDNFYNRSPDVPTRAAK